MGINIIIDGVTKFVVRDRDQAEMFLKPGFVDELVAGWFIIDRRVSRAKIADMLDTEPDYVIGRLIRESMHRDVERKITNRAQLNSYVQKIKKEYEIE